MDAEVKKYETKEYKLVNTDEKSEPYIKKDYDKWKPIIDASKKIKCLCHLLEASQDYLQVKTNFLLTVLV